MEIFCFAGPNGSGKTTTFQRHMQANGLHGLEFINADIISANNLLHIADQATRDYTAAKLAEQLRHDALNQGDTFAFETVLSTPRNLDFLKLAKEKGADINLIYVLTRDKEINVRRVARRVTEGGHDVPVEKIRERL